MNVDRRAPTLCLAGNARQGLDGLNRPPALPDPLEGGRRLAVGAAAVGLLIVATACGGGSAPEHTFEVITEDGVPTAVSSAQPKFDGELFSYEKVLEIRGNPDHPEAFLYDPYDLALDDAGNVYVAEQGNHRVSVWDSEGNYLHSFGHAGQGPGELPFGPVQITLRDGILAVPMLQNGTALRFRTDGTYIDTVGHDSITRSVFDAWKSPDESLVLVGQQCDRQSEPMQCGLRATVFGAGGEGRSTLDAGTVASANYGGAAMAILIPNRREILLTTGVEPVLRWYDLDGTLTRQARIELPVETVSQAERDAQIARYDQRIEELEGRQRDNWIRMRDEIRFPETKAFWAYSIADDEGYLWLSKPMAEPVDYEVNFAVEFRVVSPEGEYLGDTQPPPLRGSSRIYRGRYLALVFDAESGEQIPTVFRLRPRHADFVYP